MAVSRFQAFARTRCTEEEVCKNLVMSSHHRFTPEAAIINYYHMDSTLSGHTDQSELDHTAPLVSTR